MAVWQVAVVRVIPLDAHSAATRAIRATVLDTWVTLNSHITKMSVVDQGFHPLKSNAGTVHVLVELAIPYESDRFDLDFRVHYYSVSTTL